MGSECWGARLRCPIPTPSHPTSSRLVSPHLTPSYPIPGETLHQRPVPAAWRAGDPVSASLCFLPPAPWETSRHPRRAGSQEARFQIQITVPWGDAQLHQAVVLAGWRHPPRPTPQRSFACPLSVVDPQLETQLLTNEFSEFKCPLTKLIFQFTGVPASRMRFGCTVYYVPERERSGLNGIFHCKSHLHE